MNWEDKALEVAQELMRILGPSYTEKVYEEAFLHEPRLQDVRYERQRNIEIVYKNHRIGERRPDCILNPHWYGMGGPEFLVEMKALKKIGKQHILQAQVYLSSMNIPAGILLNFNTETGLPEIRQVTLAERATVQKNPGRP